MQISTGSQSSPTIDEGNGDVLNIRKRSHRFVWAALVAGSTFWCANRWSGRVRFSDGSVGEFVTPVWIQATASAVVGCVWGGMITAAALVLAVVRSRLGQHRT